MKKKILIVDDNQLNTKLVRVLLTGEGYEVRTALDAQEALEELNRATPDLILMDIQLPGIDGLELTRRLKADEKNRDIRIIALTAYATKGHEERIIAAGCDAYVPKPVDTRTLPELIKKYLV